MSDFCCIDWSKNKNKESTIGINYPQFCVFQFFEKYEWMEWIENLVFATISQNKKKDHNNRLKVVCKKDSKQCAAVIVIKWIKN